MNAKRRNCGLGRVMLMTLLCSLCLCWAQAARAQDAAVAPLQSSMTAYLVEKGEDGKETLTEVNQVKPGQTIEYALRYSNVSDGDLAEVNIVGPVPAGTNYLAGSALPQDGARPQFSIDNGASYKSEPVTYKVKMADGTELEKVATPDMYTHVSWTLPKLLAKQQLSLTYRVQVR
jgi:uncharacterized repeat protein (TIGR01451 family)